MKIPSTFTLKLAPGSDVCITSLQLLCKADNDTVMEAVDPEPSLTCMDLAHVKETFQLALLCTKRNPSKRPTMHEVARVLVSQLPAPTSKIFGPPEKTINYAQFVIKKGHQPQHGNNSLGS